MFRDCAGTETLSLIYDSRKAGQIPLVLSIPMARPRK
jgi:hypothetical protein